MSQMTETPVKTYVAATALAKYIRVKKNAGKVEVAGAAEAGMGQTETVALEPNDDVAVRLSNAPGTCIMVAAGAIPAGADVFAAADGKIAAAGTVKLGTNDGAAAIAGDYVEVLRP